MILLDNNLKSLGNKKAEYKDYTAENIKEGLIFNEADQTWMVPHSNYKTPEYKKSYKVIAIRDLEPYTEEYVAAYCDTLDQALFCCESFNGAVGIQLPDLETRVKEDHVVNYTYFKFWDEKGNSTVPEFLNVLGTLIKHPKFNTNNMPPYTKK